MEVPNSDIEELLIHVEKYRNVIVFAKQWRRTELIKVWFI